jgi:predicted transcriptional regulator
MAYAYKLGKVKVYGEPKELADFGLRTAPQSFAYVVS